MENQNNPTGKPDRRRTSAAERMKMLERYRASGLTRQAFCQQEGISIHKLDFWRRKEKKVTKGKGLALREVQWPATVPPEGWSMEIVSPAGWTIRRREPLSVEEIGQLVREAKC
jgi:hypothetical protein